MTIFDTTRLGRAVRLAAHVDRYATGSPIAGTDARYDRSPVVEPSEPLRRRARTVRESLTTVARRLTRHAPTVAVHAVVVGALAAAPAYETLEGGTPPPHPLERRAERYRRDQEPPDELRHDGMPEHAGDRRPHRAVQPASRAATLVHRAMARHEEHAHLSSPPPRPAPATPVRSISLRPGWPNRGLPDLA